MECGIQKPSPTYFTSQLFKHSYILQSNWFQSLSEHQNSKSSAWFSVASLTFETQCRADRSIWMLVTAIFCSVHILSQGLEREPQSRILMGLLASMRAILQEALLCTSPTDQECCYQAQVVQRVWVWREHLHRHFCYLVSFWFLELRKKSEKADWYNC